jgi:hypothetical protein
MGIGFRRRRRVSRLGQNPRANVVSVARRYLPFEGRYYEDVDVKAKELLVRDR